jgi:hypothetical protein
MTIPAMFCNHANERPQSCPCDEDCYCRLHTCRRVPRIADLAAAHAISIDTEVHMLHSLFRYRWECSCGDRGPWKDSGTKGHAKAVRSARNGGQRHVAAMEKR